MWNPKRALSQGSSGLAEEGFVGLRKGTMSLETNVLSSSFRTSGLGFLGLGVQAFSVRVWVGRVSRGDGESTFVAFVTEYPPGAGNNFAGYWPKSSHVEV